MLTKTNIIKKYFSGSVAFLFSFCESMADGKNYGFSAETKHKVQENEAQTLCRIKQLTLAK